MTEEDDKDANFNSPFNEVDHIKRDTIEIRVSGNTYEMELDDVRRAPESKLYRCVFKGSQSSMTFKRPIQSFEAVLAYYQTGELHMPMSVCPGAFKTELNFWGIDPQVLSKCCYYRYLSHIEDQETLDKFHLHLFPDFGSPKEDRRCLNGLRNKLWNVLDDHDSSIQSKIYFYLCMLMVILSVLTLALSTLPHFRRSLTLCEYEAAVGKRLKSANEKIDLNNSCTKPLTEDILDDLYTDFETVTINITNEVTTTDPNDLASRPMRNMSRTFAFNLGSPMVENQELFSHVIEALKPKLGIQKKTVRIDILVYLDCGILAFFTFDIILRILCCPRISKYFLSTVNVIDALVILAAYAHLIVNTINVKEQYETTGMDLLEVFQVLRVVRLIRVVRNVTGFKVLTFSVKESLQELLVLLLYIVLGIVIFANFIFFVEPDSVFSSIPDGWWWAINTLTTVGYGDIAPTTLYGKLIGAICAVFGIVMMAVAIPVFVKTFILLYGYAVLYKKSISKPEDTHMYIHMLGIKRAQKKGRGKAGRQEDDAF